MLFIDPNGIYPKYIPDVIAENPEWEEGNELPEGWEIVAWGEYPTDVPEGKIVDELSPLRVDGQYVQQFAVRDMTEDELARANAPKVLRQKLADLGLSDIEIQILRLGTF